MVRRKVDLKGIAVVAAFVLAGVGLADLLRLVPDRIGQARPRPRAGARPGSASSRSTSKG
ncbi:MAG: hypothetical protein MZU95_06820 [Desulfomicrobium escambiense]|nr:hypothetical protein [Desulfomicrobium escambiense]